MIISNIIEICGRDSFSESPVINHTANFNKLNEDVTEFVLPDGNVVKRSVVLKNPSGVIIPSVLLNLFTNDSWVNNGKYYKTMWSLNALGAGTLEIVLSDDLGNLELLTDRNRTRIVDRDRTYLWRFDDIENSGYDVTYIQNGSDIIVKVMKGDYVPVGGQWIIDPIVAGLNTNCENETITLDTTSPTIDFGIGTEANNSIKNQNFVYVNVSVVEENEDTIIFYLYNSTNDLINNLSYTNQTRIVNFTNLNDSVYYYKVFVNDSVGFNVTTSLRQITLDTTAPSLIINSPTSGQIFYEVNTVFNITAIDSGGGIDTQLYSIDSGSNVSFNGYKIFTQPYTNFVVVFCVNDSVNNINCSSSISYGVSALGATGISGGAIISPLDFEIEIDTDLDRMEISIDDVIFYNKEFAVEAEFFDIRNDVITIDNVTIKILNNVEYSEKPTKILLSGKYVKEFKVKSLNFKNITIEITATKGDITLQEIRIIPIQQPTFIESVGATTQTFGRDIAQFISEYLLEILLTVTVSSIALFLYYVIKINFKT